MLNKSKKKLSPVSTQRVKFKSLVRISWFEPQTRVLLCICFLTIFSLSAASVQAEEVTEKAQEETMEQPPELTEQASEKSLEQQEEQAEELVEQTKEDIKEQAEEKNEITEEQKQIDKNTLIEEQKKKIKPEDYTNAAKLLAIKKTTARNNRLIANLNKTVEFDSLEIKLLSCWKAPEGEMPENKALLEIWDTNSKGEKKQVFYGWMFSSSPSLNILEHPVYDITILECVNNEVKPADAL